MIFKFQNYRAFLKSVLEERRERNPRFSLGVWARRLKLSGSSGLVMILKGHRNAGPDLIERMVQEIGLSEKEAEYFRLLTRLDHVFSEAELAELQCRIRILQSAALEQAPPLSQSVLRCISHWLPVTLRAMASVPGFREDIDWIQGQLLFSAPKEKIVAALKDLEESGLLIRDPFGQLTTPGNLIFPNGRIPTEELKALNENVYDLFQQAASQVPISNCVMVGATYGGRLEDITLLREKAKEFVRSAVQTSPEDKRNQPLMVQVTVLPLAKPSVQKDEFI
jgi:uncharacterized protein (TIGR02147 family)